MYLSHKPGQLHVTLFHLVAGRSSLVQRGGPILVAGVDIGASVNECVQGLDIALACCIGKWGHASGIAHVHLATSPFQQCYDLHIATCSSLHPYGATCQ